MSVNLYRSNVQRLTKQKADLEKQLGQKRQKIAKLTREIGTIQRSITKSASPTTLRSKSQQVERKQTALSQAAGKAADIERKIATKLAELNRNIQSLEKAEERASKKRRDDEIRHVREVTRETQKQASLHAQLSRSPLVITISQLPTKIKVLFLAANPQDQMQLRLDEEIRIITEKIRASEYRDSVELISKWAVRTMDLLQALNEHKPHVLHFSGHGRDTDELAFLDADGNTKFVTKEAITATISTVADDIRLIVFNSCFSSGQAEAVTQYVDAAIGMNTTISEEAARIFAAQFYSAIGFGRSVTQAFDQAVAALMLEGIPEDKTPQLFTRDDIEATEIILVRPDAMEQ